MMDWANVLAFSAVATLLVISPGPNGVLIARTVPISGKAAGFAAVAGFVAAFFLHGTLSIFGISALLMASSQAFFIVRMLGAAYLCWLGVKALYEAFRGQPAALASRVPAARRSPVTAFVEGFLTNALNPKVSMFYLAAFPQFLSVGQGSAASAFFLVLLHAAINAAWFTGMILLLARLTQLTRQGSFQRWLKGITGVVFVGFGIRLATSRS